MNDICNRFTMFFWINEITSKKKDHSIISQTQHGVISYYYRKVETRTILRYIDQ